MLIADAEGSLCRDRDNRGGISADYRDRDIFLFACAIIAIADND